MTSSSDKTTTEVVSSQFLIIIHSDNIIMCLSFSKMIGTYDYVTGAS